MGVRQPEPNRDSEAFLSALADELSSPPDPLTTARHVSLAVRVSRSERRSARNRSIRWAAAVVTAATVFGTGGIAVAGGLAAPIQSVVADMARALPVPFDIPYPTVTDLEQESPGSRLSQVNSEVAGEGSTGAISHSSPAPLPSAPTAPVPDDTPGTRGDQGAESDPERDRCDLGELWDDDEVRDADEMEQLRAEIQAACGFDLLDPPGWARDDLAYLTGADPTEDGRDDAGRDREDEDRDDRDRDDRRDRDRASDSPGEDRRGESDDNESDEQEERHEDDEDDAGSGSSDDEWRDRQE
jgi:hypothetical protein